MCGYQRNPQTLADTFTFYLRPAAMSTFDLKSEKCECTCGYPQVSPQNFRHRPHTSSAFARIMVFQLLFYKKILFKVRLSASQILACHMPFVKETTKGRRSRRGPTYRRNWMIILLVHPALNSKIKNGNVQEKHTKCKRDKRRLITPAVWQQDNDNVVRSLRVSLWSN